MVSEVLGRRAQAVEQERAILRCMSVGTVDVRLQKEKKKKKKKKKKKGGSSVVARGATSYIRHIYSLAVRASFYSDAYCV